jgi:ATP-dependent Clp protease ATP-binding subunit ClpA
MGGIGKTALAEGLALQIHEGRVPHALKDARLFALDMGASWRAPGFGATSNSG